MAPTPKVRAYPNFLTPLLHRRFSRASVTILGICYIEAILLGRWDSMLWSWFPLGLVGIRTGLLFICAFSIFVLRVAQLHIGLRTTTSGFGTFKKYVFRYQTMHTAGWYLFSAWLFSEIYIFSAPNTANIHWITDARNNERPRLNERPIYLTSFFLMLAVVQTAVHIFYDYDRIDMPMSKITANGPLLEEPHPVLPASSRMRSVLPALAPHAMLRSLVMAVLGPFIYSIFIRQSAWSYTLVFAKLVWNLPRSSALPVISPFHYRLLARTVFSGFYLNIMWDAANVAFSTYVAQEPLKNGRPITFESRDPNGSLLSGLTAKKLQTRAFAFWELVFISERYQGRRKTLFEDIDRPGGSTWSQLLAVCIKTISGIDERISTSSRPLVPATEPANKIEVPGLPRLAAAPKQAAVFTKIVPRTPREKLEDAVGAVAKGQTQSSPIDTAQQMFNMAKSKVLTPENEKSLTPTGLLDLVRPYLLRLLQTPLGVPFRQTLRRRMNAVVLGQPYGDVGIIIDAITSLSRLSVASLKEDPYGNVSRDVPQIIRTLTNTATRLEDYESRLGFHWSDIEKKRMSPEVDAILLALKAALNELMAAFGDYSEDLKLSQKDLDDARTVATPAKKEQVDKAVEMQQI